MKFTKRSYRSLSLTLVAVALIAYGSWGILRKHRATHDTERTQLEAAVVTETVSAPAETPPKDSCDGLQVAAHEPRFIKIPAISASGCVQKVGIDQNQAVAAPSNIHVAGWYTGSVEPGELGLSIIDGHVQGKYADGIFKNLKKLKPGDVIEVQMGDNSRRQFLVRDNISHHADQAGQELFEKIPGDIKQLTLITCGGDFDKNSETYSHRVIVRAVAS